VLIKQHLNIFQMCSLTFALEVSSRVGEGGGHFNREAVILGRLHHRFPSQECELRNRQALFPIQGVQKYFLSIIELCLAEASRRAKH
jgi:hypothetical protein